MDESRDMGTLRGEGVLLEEPSRKKHPWWARQWVIIAVSAGLLAPVIYVVAGLFAAESAGDAARPTVQAAEDTGPEDGGVARPDDEASDRGGRTATESADGRDGLVASSTGGSPAGVDDGDDQTFEEQPAEPATDPCEHVLALRDAMDGEKINPVQVYARLLAVRQETEGSRVGEKVDHAVGAMEGYAVGTHDREDVIAAAKDLLAAC